ncbi:MAG TPA: hypothetical protein VGH21_06140 [Solirubrobacteraceae bacterium]|jgi:hypothetical protein
MIVSVLIRRLREGKTYADFRAAWLPEKGFGVPDDDLTDQPPAA